MKTKVPEKYSHLIESGKFAPHGSPFDRGQADSYYRRGRDPHWYPNGSYKEPRIDESEMTPEEIQEYHLGFDHNEEMAIFKNWGDD